MFSPQSLTLLRLMPSSSRLVDHQKAMFSKSDQVRIYQNCNTVFGIKQNQVFWAPKMLNLVSAWPMQLQLAQSNWL